MPVVMVHGNLRRRRVGAVGRGARPRRCDLPVAARVRRTIPEVWGARVEEYRDWLAGELAAIGTPVDLVGHDWGGAHVVNVAMTRPELLRSWCTDVIGIYDPDYVWHDLARVWQTPVEGEHAVGAMIGTPFAERAAGLIGAGTAAVAERIAPAVDEDMARCILALYRSAAQPRMAQLGQDLRNARASWAGPSRR